MWYDIRYYLRQRNDIQRKFYISEALRKYPPTPFLIRHDCRLPEVNLALEKGIRIMIPLWSIHNDPQYYPEPEKFDPERFSAEKKLGRNCMTFMPFGDGPSICIGHFFIYFLFVQAIVKYFTIFGSG